MTRPTLLTLAFLVCSTACFAQTSSPDSQALQALLSEVRQLRQDMQTTVIASQRAQILIYRLQMEEAAMERASKRTEDARDKLARIQDERRHIAAEVKRSEDAVDAPENSAAQKKALADRLAALKTRLETLEVDEQQSQSRQIEADQQQRAEEAKLTDLREQLDRLDKTLEKASRPQK
jgi:chromosome segregation ATPase